MAYPPKSKGVDPNEEYISTNVAVRPVQPVVAPSATGGAPPVRDGRNYRPVWREFRFEDTGSVNSVPPPATSIADFQAANAPAVNALAERLRTRLEGLRADGTELDGFWSGVAMSPEAAAASVLRRVQMLRDMQGNREQYFRTDMAARLNQSELFQFIRWVRGG